MADVIINLTSQPTMPNGTVLSVGDFRFTNSRLQSDASIGHSETNTGYIRFDAIAGTVRATIGVSSESNYDFMTLHVSTSATPPSRKSGNMANISGEVSGTEYSYTITSAGTYYLHFVYAKDSSNHVGSDIGWITRAVLPMAGGAWTNVNGVWKQGEKFVNVSGVWKSGQPWVNINGVWKQGQ